MRKTSKEFSFTDFVNQFLYMAICLLSSDTVPRVSADIKRTLHLNEQCKVGDWYLYQNHTEVRVYACQLTPYKLPKYLPMRIFSLEYIRKIINSDDVNFLSARKKTQFKIKNQLGPFICNNREAGEEAEKCLQEMKFSSSFMW